MAGSRSRSPKLRRIARGEDDYALGNITEVEMRNFMTYSHMKVQPQPRLNVVIGPNGTGKSSLVCAIGIGLGAEPQHLGRASNIGDFVKRGEESGWISISLRGPNPGETTVIRRNMMKNNKSDWQINGRATTKKDVFDTVQKFNIQVTNLTQFLPQDRVCEFAKMSPVQLLEETEKAVGDPELSKQHIALIEKSEEVKKLQMTVRQNEATLNQYKANNADLEKDVERLEQRNQLLKKVELMKKKLPWLLYDKRKKSLQDAKTRENEAKDRVEEIAGRMVILHSPIDERKKKKERLEASNRKLQQQFTANEQKRAALAAFEAKKAEQVKSLTREIENLHKQEALRAEKTERARQDVADAEAELANLESHEPPKERVIALRSRITEFDTATRNKAHEVQDKERARSHALVQLDAARSRLSEMDTAKYRKLEALHNPGVRNAYDWVQANTNHFRKNVYGPVLLEVEILGNHREHATYLEGHVPFYIWKSFITQDIEDRDLLVKNLKQYGVPVLNSQGTSGGQNSQAVRISHELQELGITMTLDQVFSAPQTVKDVLVSQALLDSSFIGGSNTNAAADRANQLGVTDLWTPDNHFRWNKSRYGGHTSTSVYPVNQGRLFSHGVDPRQREQVQQRILDAETTVANLNVEISSLKSELRQLEVEAATHHREMEEIQNAVRLDRRKRQEATSKLEQRTKRLESMLNEENVEQSASRLQSRIADENEERCDKALELKEHFREAVQNHILYVAQHLSVMELDAQIREMEQNFRGQEQLALHAQQELDECKAQTGRCRAALLTAKAEAERTAELTPELQRKFAKMPTTVEELQDSIDETAAEANAVLCPNPNILEEYRRRCAQISQLTDKLAVEKASLSNCVESIETIKSQWLPTLRELVSRINGTFGRNFREMAVAGEVTLDEHGEEFDKYGILIKVKFRQAGELQVLSAQHQSGGERSVATILYLVSLQDLSHCPFRVVDEINQGMDPNNERKMFQQLVRASSQANTPQCLLLTPKLLPDLEYSPACTVLTIMNGPWIARASQKWRDGAPYSITTQDDG